MLFQNDRIIEIDAPLTNDVLLTMLATTLYDTNTVKLEFIKAVNDRELEFPTGIDMETHAIAIPHSEYDLVNETGFAVATIPNKTVAFKSADDGETILYPSIVIMMAISQDSPIDKVSIIQNIFSQLADKDIVDKIVKSDDPLGLLNEILG